VQKTFRQHFGNISEKTGRYVAMSASKMSNSKMLKNWECRLLWPHPDSHSPPRRG
jgi:hypothetical protein